MKTLLLCAFLSICNLQIKAQCAETLSGFGNNPDQDSYNIVGDVTLILNTNNTITLNLGSNFSTAPGPDVRAFLVDSNDLSDAVLATALIANLNHFEIGLTQATGRQTFTVAIPDDKNITDFDKVFFYCLEFNHFWDLGTFTSFTPYNCTVLNTNGFNLSKVAIHPNPAKNKIQISNLEVGSAEIRIFNVLGKQVFYQTKITKNTINISSFNKGIYLVNIKVNDKVKNQKLVIQ